MEKHGFAAVLALSLVFRRLFCLRRNLAEQSEAEQLRLIRRILAAELCIRNDAALYNLGKSEKLGKTRSEIDAVSLGRFEVNVALAAVKRVDELGDVDIMHLNFSVDHIHNHSFLKFSDSGSPSSIIVY